MKKAKIKKTIPVKEIEENDNLETTAPELQKLVYIFGGLVVVFLLFYAITYFKLKMDNQDQEKEEVFATIQYDEILTGNLLEQNNSDYYVLVYDEEEAFTKMYKAFINLYLKKENALRVYYSDLNNTFNQKYKNENSNLKVTNVQDLKISKETLFKIKNGKIVNTYEGEENILKAFKDLIK